ncbi:MAG: CRISPR-associated helicase Cas3' [Betaproteobacteria bacterium]|nr:CRISPR-associated helicase Cas3' [Betaproteobacteria bacterium]
MGMVRPLDTASFFRYWGKADPNYPDEPKWHPLVYHCLDVAAVAALFQERVPEVQAMLRNKLRVNDECALGNWLAFWSALHDLGKFSEAFQSQRSDVFMQLRSRAPDPGKPYRVRHDSLGMMFWKSVLSDVAVEQAWFGKDTGLYLDGLDYWMRAVTGHHGQPPEEASEYWTQHFSAQEDRAAVFAFVAEMRTLFLDDATQAIPQTLDPEAFYRVSIELSWWIAGITVLADWIGSNTTYFGYRHRSASVVEYWAYARKEAERALDACGVLPVAPPPEQSFHALFPEIESPSPLQRWAAGIDLSKEPQIYLLEDVTGAGKTEAAVTLAHRLMAVGCAEGFFIGLPTMATSNAMYGRIAQVYARLFAGQASLVLAHGQRNLIESFAASVLPRSAAENDIRQVDETATARCTAWLADHNKRALLAPAGIGTLDQALLAVLHSKHQSLRLLGLFRKVLVVDEVHACDAYMQRVLETLLEFHAHAGGSAILLSATLPQKMKQSLLNAFARGAGKPAVPSVQAQAYPLATGWRQSAPTMLQETALQSREDVCRVVAVRYISDESEIIAAIETALAVGRCVCWMRNTVVDALDAYAKFKDRLPAGRLTLFHARFALRDRLQTERKVLALFGERSTPQRRCGRLVIATQVVEQSLDVDWDLVISDLAPIDRLIQRGGRLMRHVRDARGRRLREPGAREGRGEPCLWVHGPAWVEDPPAGWYKARFRRAAAVYPHHGQLWLTADLLRKLRIEMPADARNLIEGVFGERTEIPPSLRGNANRAEGNAYADMSVAQQNSVKLVNGYVREGIDWWSEAKTPSRLGEATTTVVLARWEGGQLRPWVDGKHGWAYSSVRVAERLIARRAEGDSTAREATISAVEEALPGKGKWSVLLPLQETAKGWIGRAWTSKDQRRDERLHEWLYDRQMGLRQTVASDSEGEDNE